MVTAIIMASGFSRRMGKNKLLMEFNDKPLVENIFIEVSKVDFKEVILVSQYEEVLKIGKKYNFKCILNENAIIGQSESIKIGLNTAKESRGYMFFVGDQPLIKSHYIKKIVDKFKENSEFIIIPKNEEKLGNPVIFPLSKKNELLSLKNDEKGKKVIKSSKNIKFVEVSKEMLFDVDTIEDLNKIKGVYNETY
jgi:molybdenum cofactor cytidylyltransferase